MAREEELKRIDLKVNVGCCEGCRRKVMKAMSMKGVLRTEIKPSHDRVTVVGDVDARVLVKKLAKIGKTAEVLQAPSCEDGKKRDDKPAPAEEKQSRGKDYDDKSAPPAEEEKNSRGKDDDEMSAAACKRECNKCAHDGAARAVEDNNSGGKDEKAPPSSKAAAAARSAEEEGNGGFGAKSSAPDDHAAAAAQQQQQQFHHHYHRAEPAAMVVPVHVPYYPPPPTAGAPFYGYYAVPPPMMMMGAAPRRAPQLLRPQPSRFDADFFNDDNTVGCSVM